MAAVLLYGAPARKEALPALIYVLQTKLPSETEYRRLAQMSMATLGEFGKDVEAALPAIRPFLKDKQLGSLAEKVIEAIKTDTKIQRRNGA